MASKRKGRGKRRPRRQRSAAAGRPSKLLPAVKRKICRALADGATRKDAAIAGGIDYATFKRWMALGVSGAEEHAEFCAFCASVREAEAKAAVDHLATIRKSARKGNWRAAAWWLERRRARDFGRKIDVNHGGKIGVAKVLEEDDWYGNDAHRKAAEAPAPPAPGADVAGTLQGGGVRPALGEDGGRPPEGAAGPRSDA